MNLRVTCANCGEDCGRVFCFSDEGRDRILERCSKCRANFQGPGVWLPHGFVFALVGGKKKLSVDPCAACSHGHGPHRDRDDVKQEKLFGDA